MNRPQVRTRSDVIHLILQYAHQLNMPKLKRAWEEGHVELLGGFHCLRGECPGWAVLFDCCDSFSRPFYMGVIIRDFVPRVVLLEEINWAEYDGDKSKNPLYCGDKPDEYKLLKEGGVVWPVAENQQMTV